MEGVILGEHPPYTIQPQVEGAIDIIKRAFNRAVFVHPFSSFYMLTKPCILDYERPRRLYRPRACRSNHAVRSATYAPTI